MEYLNVLGCSSISLLNEYVMSHSIIVVNGSYESIHYVIFHHAISLPHPSPSKHVLECTMVSIVYFQVLTFTLYYFFSCLIICMVHYSSIFGVSN